MRPALFCVAVNWHLTVSQPDTHDPDKPTWVRPSQTQATLRDHLERVTRGDTLKVRAPTGTFELTRRRGKFHVDSFGTGGGWCWNDTWSLSAAVNHLSSL